MNKLTRVLLPLLMLLPCPQGFASPTWIEQASRPGPDVASIGQSRFDQLFRQASDNYSIPYPFERLIEALERQVDNGENPAVRQVFIPMGRSLQRDTPAPDYFLFPRKVVALEGEPVTVGKQAGLVMEYRLFIAHLPKTETLEVISYNDAVGRFEFQLVTDYGADKIPRVSPANRAMCMSCHHNAAPIFARIPWRETSFNVEVASKLVDALPRQYSSLVGIVTLDAGIIDVLVERANYLSAAQLIWRRGCTSTSCRAAMLRAVLQYRLSGESSFESTVASYQHDYYDVLMHNWSRQWPQGLALASSRLSDRNPFAPDAATIGDDPMLPRPAQATWYRVDSTLADGIIYRLAGFFTRTDIQRIDRQLIASAKPVGAKTDHYRAACHTRSSGPDSQILSCGENASAESLQAKLEVEISQGTIRSLRIISLKIPRDSNLLQPDIIELTGSPGRLEARLGNDRAKLSMRLASGDRIDSMTLSWDESLVAGSSLEISVLREFVTVDKALASLLENHLAGQAKSLQQTVFRREPVLQELMRELSMDSLEWLPAARNTIPKKLNLASRIEGGLALLEPYCAHCHGDETLHPPGFLSGVSAQQRIIQCAPRILRRLQAWHENSRFPRSPMPPPASIEYSGISAVDWPLSDHYRTLLSSIEDLVIERQGRQQLGDWKATDYGDLPPCLAETSES